MLPFVINFLISEFGLKKIEVYLALKYVIFRPICSNSGKLAEWSKALCLGRNLKGHEFESHICQNYIELSLTVIQKNQIINQNAAFYHEFSHIKVRIKES